MRKYKPIYIIAFFCLLGFAAKAQDTLTSEPLEGKLALSFGMAVAPSDVITSTPDNMQPQFFDLDFGVNKFFQNNLYIGLRSGSTRGNFENTKDTTYNNISAVPFGFTFGAWSSNRLAGLEFSGGFLIPNSSPLQVRSGTYFDAKILIFMGITGKVALSLGYRNSNFSLADYTYLNREFFSTGLRVYLY